MLCRIKQYSSFEIIENKNKVKPYFYRKIKPHFSCLEPYFFKLKNVQYVWLLNIYNLIKILK